jgi:hypothetical protein
MIQETPQKIHALLPGCPRPWDVVSLVILAIYIPGGISGVSFYGDRSTYIWGNQDYDLVVKQGDIPSILFSQLHATENTAKNPCPAARVFTSMGRDLPGHCRPIHSWGNFTGPISWG